AAHHSPDVAPRPARDQSAIRHPTRHQAPVARAPALSPANPDDSSTRKRALPPSESADQRNPARTNHAQRSSLAARNSTPSHQLSRAAPRRDKAAPRAQTRAGQPRPTLAASPN